MESPVSADMADGQRLSTFEEVATDLRRQREAGQVTYITDDWEYEIPTAEEIEEAEKADYVFLTPEEVKEADVAVRAADMAARAADMAAFLLAFSRKSPT
jgi:hypothetical protein